MILPSFQDGIFIEVDSVPLDFVIVRASNVPDMVLDQRSVVKAGITGSDILWESGLGKTRGEEVPITSLNPNAKQSFLYVGYTKEFCEKIQKEKLRDPLVLDLSGVMTTTKYPRIASDYFTEQGVKNINLYEIPGKDEAMQYCFPDLCFAVLGTTESGKTGMANNLKMFEKFYQVTVRMIENGDKLTRRDKEVLDDIREKTAVALQKKREI